MNTGLTSGIPAADDPIQARASAIIRSSRPTASGTRRSRGTDLGAANIGNVDNVQSAAGVDQLVSQSDDWDGDVGAGARSPRAPVLPDRTASGAGPVTKAGLGRTGDQGVSGTTPPSRRTGSRAGRPRRPIERCPRCRYWPARVCPAAADAFQKPSVVRIE